MCAGWIQPICDGEFSCSARLSFQLPQRDDFNFTKQFEVLLQSVIHMKNYSVKMFYNIMHFVKLMNMAKERVLPHKVVISF